MPSCIEACPRPWLAASSLTAARSNGIGPAPHHTFPAPRAQELKSRLIELADKDLAIEVGRIVPVLTTPPQLRGGNDLGHLEKKGIAAPQMLLVGLECLEVVGRIAVIIKERAVKCEVDFQDREVFEILGDAVYWQDLFSVSMVLHLLCALPDTALIALLSIDLSQPASLSVASSTHLYL